MLSSLHETAVMRVRELIKLLAYYLLLMLATTKSCEIQMYLVNTLKTLLIRMYIFIYGSS